MIEVKNQGRSKEESARHKDIEKKRNTISLESFINKIKKPALHTKAGLLNKNGV